jgi:hypothetical protein
MEELKIDASPWSVASLHAAAIKMAPRLPPDLSIFSSFSDPY